MSGELKKIVCDANVDLIVSVGIYTEGDISDIFEDRRYVVFK